MTAPSRTSSLRANTRSDIAEMFARSPHLVADSALLGWIASAVEHRSPTELKAVVLGVLDAQNDARLDGP